MEENFLHGLMFELIFGHECQQILTPDEQRTDYQVKELLKGTDNDGDNIVSESV